jgi:cystathionine beta-lyase
MEYLTGNLSAVTEYFKENPHGVKLIKPEATYLLWIDFRDLKLTREQLQEKIIMKGNIALDYGYRYGSEGFLRFSIGGTRAMVKKGLERIDYALSNL